VALGAPFHRQRRRRRRYLHIYKRTHTYIYLHAGARNLQQPSSPLSQLGCNLKAEANGLLLQRAASASSIKFATRSNPFAMRLALLLLRDLSQCANFWRCNILHVVILIFRIYDHAKISFIAPQKFTHWVMCLIHLW
jgi:hypothetical protein